jgi:hypothetical protein
MHAFARLVLTLVPLALFAAGCDKAAADRDQASALGAQRLMLNQGYSLLYTDASNIGLVDLVLYVKSDPKKFDKIITEISTYGSELKKHLERIARDYPAVRLDLKPLPEMEMRKRSAITRERERYFAPVIGHGGREYERTMLIAMSNGLNHERHLCQVMAAEEPEPGLKYFLLESEHRYDALYALVTNELNREYFKSNKAPRKEP